MNEKKKKDELMKEEEYETELVLLFSFIPFFFVRRNNLV